MDKDLEIKIYYYDMQLKQYIFYRKIHIDENFWHVKARSNVYAEFFAKYESNLGIILSANMLLFHSVQKKIIYQ